MIAIVEGVTYRILGCAYHHSAAERFVAVILGAHIIQRHQLATDFQIRFSQHIDQLLGDGVTILFQKSTARVFNGVREMLDEER